MALALPTCWAIGTEAPPLAGLVAGQGSQLRPVGEQGLPGAKRLPPPFSLEEAPPRELGPLTAPLRSAPGLSLSCPKPWPGSPQPSHSPGPYPLGLWLAPPETHPPSGGLPKGEAWAGAVTGWQSPAYHGF